MEASVHWDTAGPHGTQETGMTQCNLEEPRVNCKHSRASENTGTNWTFPRLMWTSAHCDTARPNETQEMIVTQGNLMEASVISFTARPHGTQKHSVMQWNTCGTKFQFWTMQGLMEHRCHLWKSLFVVTQHNLMKLSRALWQHGISQMQGSTLTEGGFMESLCHWDISRLRKSKCPLWHRTSLWITGEHSNTMESSGTECHF